MFTLIISSLLVQLSIPAFAPARRIDYIEHLPVVPVGDVSMDYEKVTIRSITGSGWGGFSPDMGERSIVIDCIGYGVVDLTLPSGDVIDGLFFQKISLKVVIADAIQIGEPLDVSGRSNLTIFTPDGKRASFKGIIDGTAIPTTNFIDAISFLINLQYRAGATQEYSGEPSALLGSERSESSGGLFLSLAMEGLLPSTGEFSASGQLLRVERAG